MNLDEAGTSAKIIIRQTRGAESNK